LTLWRAIEGKYPRDRLLLLALSMPEQFMNQKITRA